MASHRIIYPATLCRTFFILLLSPILVACPSKSKNPSPQTKPALLEEKARNCEVQIRKQMAEASLYLQPVDAFSAEIKAHNTFIKKADTPDFFFKKDTKVRVVGVTHQSEADNLVETVEYKLERSSDETSPDLNLKIVTKSLKPKNSLVELEQNLNVNSDSNCLLTITSTEKSTLYKIDSKNFRFTEQRFLSDGKETRDSKEFSIPTDAPFENLENISDVETSTKFYHFSPDAGVITSILKEPSEKSLTEFNQKIVFKISNYQIYSADKKPLFVSSIGVSDDSDLYFTEVLNKKTWHVPKDTWDSVYLDGTQSYSPSNVNYMLSNDYLYKNYVIEVVLKEKPAYENLPAYWVIQSESYDSEAQQWTLTLREHSSNKVYAPSSKEDLVSNETIQVNLPKIQQIAAGIGRNKNREEQVKMILDYLDKNYSYDYSMLKNNTVTRLTTEEALRTGKGVCQHYAVIFVSIARALGIPSRIITGFHFSNHAVAHAWNEVEIEPGLWQVIEPQDPNSLKEMYTRFYFPLARATSLEDNKVFEDSYSLFTANYTFRPVKK